MKREVNPLVAILVIAAALGVVYYCWFYVFHGKRMGYTSPGEAAAAQGFTNAPVKKPPAGGPTREMYGLPPLPQTPKRP